PSPDLYRSPYTTLFRSLHLVLVVSDYGYQIALRTFEHADELLEGCGEHSDQFTQDLLASRQLGDPGESLGADLASLEQSAFGGRSEEHTSELQSREKLV